ncbi:MAG: GNAT family N-acetyltransferase [bacterium]|nr:GNAT family N-acetyltransferase [bacterium]
MIEISEPASGEDLADLRRAWLVSQVAPFDGMWEAFATMSRHREIRSAGEPVGYFCVNDEGRLLQFFVDAASEHAAAGIFAGIVARDEVKGAMVSTADPLFLGLTLDLQKAVRVHTRLYHDHDRREVPLAGAAGASFDVVEAGELGVIAELQRESLDEDPGDWLMGYLENLLARRELYALRLGGEVLGTGEARVSESQPPVADLGVITMRRHRGRGVAPHVLWRLKQLCYDRDLVPICSTTVDNAGARRAIAKAGFESRHRILDVAF